MAASLAALPRPLGRVLAGRPVRVDGQELDVQVQLAIRLERLLGGWEPQPAPEARAHRLHEAMVFRGPTIEVGRIRDLELPGPGGPIGARLYEPATGSAPRPLIVYFHGGGHVIGDLDTHDQPCRFLARETPALVLAVDYRLGPEHRFPAAVEDALAAFGWAHAEAATLGADPERIAVAGDSAGGNLAAVVAQLTAAADGSAPCFQALLYPVTDYSVKRRSYELFGEGFFLTREEMDWFRDNYFTGPDQHSDPRASPLWRRISPPSRPPTSSPPASTRSATRARRMPSACSRTASRPPCAASATWSTASSTRSASAAGRGRPRPPSPRPCVRASTRRPSGAQAQAAATLLDAPG